MGGSEVISTRILREINKEFGFCPPFFPKTIEFDMDNFEGLKAFFVKDLAF
jgi:hypothetical protein